MILNPVPHPPSFLSCYASWQLVPPPLPFEIPSPPLTATVYTQSAVSLPPPPQLSLAVSAHTHTCANSTVSLNCQHLAGWSEGNRYIKLNEFLYTPFPYLQLPLKALPLTAYVVSMHSLSSVQDYTFRSNISCTAQVSCGLFFFIGSLLKLQPHFNIRDRPPLADDTDIRTHGRRYGRRHGDHYHIPTGYFADTHGCPGRAARVPHLTESDRQHVQVRSSVLISRNDAVVVVPFESSG